MVAVVRRRTLGRPNEEKKPSTNDARARLPTTDVSVVTNSMEDNDNADDDDADDADDNDTIMVR
jgi:hypothetical protein